MKKLNRRDFLQRAAVLGAATVGGSAFLAACQSGGGESGGGGGGGFACDDLSGLTDAEKATRAGVNYADQSTTEGQNCANCTHYTAAAAGECGGCAVVKGPIHPEGWCTLWVTT